MNGMLKQTSTAAFYDRIVWRPLHLEMTKQDFSTIEAFVAKTLGKGFEISMNKLFQFKSTLSRTTEEEESKTREFHFSLC